jgi:hypothetical protein
MLVASAIAAAGCFLIPAAGAFGGGAAIAMLVLHQLTSDGAQVAYTVNAVTLRQTMLSHAELGRANAAIVACTTAVMLASALVAGALGGLLGTRDALVIGPAIGLVAPIALWRLRAMRTIPARSGDP